MKPHRSPSAVTKAGLIRKTMYFSQEELERMEAERERQRDFVDGRLGVATLVRAIIRERYRLGAVPAAKSAIQLHPAAR